MTQDVFDDRAQLAYTFAKDLSVQLITLSTAIMTFTMVFAKDVLKDLRPRVRTALVVAWSGYLLSVLAGIGTIMGLTGDLVSRPSAAAATDTSISTYADSSRASGDPTLQPGTQTKNAARAQIILFVVASTLVIVIFFRATPASTQPKGGTPARKHFSRVAWTRRHRAPGVRCAPDRSFPWSSL